jgi:hypothetical protein
MSVLQALDIGLSGLVLAVAVWTIAAREAVAAVVGILFCDRAALVQCAAVAAERDRLRDPRRPRFGRDPVWQRAGAPAGAAETLDRLFDRT